MSAYIVNENTIHRIVTMIASESVREVVGDTEYNLRISDDRSALGRALYAMNTDAVNQRYGEDEKAPDYTWQPVLCTKIQALKSLRCLIYQCSEGDVPETSPLYAFCENLSHTWALHIVHDLPQYEAASWS